MKKQFLNVLSLSLVLSITSAYAQKRDSVKGKTIDEVVLVNVGYGVQKKSVVTGAISKVTAKDLEKVPTNGRVEQALQGRVAGVNISTNSGSPGSASTVRVRGVTTFGGSNPIWVVDGVPVGDISFVNQSDIESIEVLKDAASAAIYGTRAAGGVILVTTKKGRKGRLSINYNGFLGFSSPSKVLKVLNATEYGAIMNEKSIAGGGNVVFNNLGSLGKGTDWQKQIFKNGAMRYNHEFSLNGGNENSNFFLSFGMLNTEGIVATDISNYDKKNFRLNSSHKIFDKLTIGENFSYSHEKTIGIGNLNTEFDGILNTAIMMDPTVPVVVTDPIVANASPYNLPYVVRDGNGNPYGISSLVGQEIVNPVALMNIRRGNFGWGDHFIGNIFGELEIIKGLKLRSSIGGRKSFYGNEYFTPKFYLNASFNNTNKSAITRNQGTTLDWLWSNTLSYNKQLDKHNFTILLGQEVNVLGEGNYTGLTHSNLPTNNYQEASFNFNIAAADKTGYSTTYTPNKFTSLFARLNYDYAEKYLLTAIFRQDGSSLFGPNKKYGYFPSVSLGWVVSKENFWKDNDYFNTLKIKGGYGKTGHVGALNPFQYLPLISGGYNYTIGNNIIIGSAPNTVENPDLHWEETSQGNIGFEAKLFNNLNITLDLYNKKTVGILQQVNIPGYVGVGSKPWANVADMSNKGVEIELNYRKKIGEVNFSALGIFSTLNNEVTYLGTGIEFITQDAPGFQSMGEVTRTAIGHSYNSFYGFQTAGVFQNWAEVNAYKNSGGSLIQPNAQPGDFRWVDINGDGKISDLDRTFLGNSIPKYNFGLTINLDYKNFDFMAFAQGAAGNKIFKGLRRLDVGNANYQTDVLTRWTGEGTSNTYPRITTQDTNLNFGRMSDFYLEKGDYLRLKIIQIGYSLPSDLIKSVGASKIRLYLSAENLYTLTKYTGYDPEIGGTVGGIDKGFYPQARTIMFGLNAQF